MAHRMLLRGVHLAERLLPAVRDEHRVVTEALVAARRPDERAFDAAVECFGLAIVGPGNRQSARELGVMAGVRSFCLHRVPHPLHRTVPVAIAGLVLGPARGENPRPSVKRVDAEPAIVG